jgi:hypothetical protein
MKTWPALLVGCGFALGLVPGLQSQEAAERSLTDKEEVELLRKRVQLLEENLGLARAEADFFRASWLDLRLRNEALGLEALTGDEQALQEKLVRVVGELYQSEKRRQLIEVRVKDLIQASADVQRATADQLAARRATYEVALRQVQEVLAGRGTGSVPSAPDLNTGQVVSLDEKLGVAVLNFGRTQGCRIGMPFKILRGDRVIGKCRVVEVRESISAALIEAGEKQEKVQVGDRLLLETIK